jgi:hypothetical protein
MCSAAPIENAATKQKTLLINALRITPGIAGAASERIAL